jgi:hypothetical protein
MLSDVWLSLSGATRHVIGASRLVISAPRIVMGTPMPVSIAARCICRCCQPSQPHHCRSQVPSALATTQVYVRNTWVFRSALTALTENYTLPVAQATGRSLLDWCSALQVPRITVEQFGKTTSSSLGMLLVRVEIIATTNCSKIFKTHVFSSYSHLCIYVSI